ncbi:helicase-associated domain-containing protein [Salinithrix halophila]|uniref:Helicase-associated domain-containing protein n=1 Tax=Salinithrix halophila TaxID=1485204 RepID=A0ABV8JLS1_9BACL
MKTLVECLESLSPHVHTRICEEHGWDGNVELSELAERLVKAARQVAEGEPDRLEHRLLRYAVFTCGCNLIPPDAGHKGETKLTPSQARMGWTMLQRKGFLFAVRRSWGKPGYWCPVEIRQACLAVWLPERGDSREDVSVAGERMAAGLWNRFFHFLIVVEREGISLTQQGDVQRRMIRKLAAELDLDVEDHRFTDSLWGQGKTPGELRLLIDLAQSEGLVEEREGSLQLREGALAAWSACSWPVLLGRLFGFVRRRLLEERPEWESLWWWMERQGDAPVALTDTFLSWKAAAGSRVSLEEWEGAWLQPLVALGWVVASLEKGGWWAWSPWAPPVFRGLPDLPAYVKPDFEIFIPIFTPWKKRWILAQFTDYMGGEQLITYEINTASVKRGVERGLSAEEMERILEELSASPLPENVRISLWQWAKQYSRVVFKEALLLRTGDERLADDLEAVPELADQIGERVGPTAFLVHPSSLSTLREQLKDLGYSAMKPMENESGRPWWKGEVHSRESVGEEEKRSAHTLTIEDRFPSLEDSVPGLNRLPQMWTSSLRSYHPSTLQHILRKAAELQVDLKWADNRKRIQRFIPGRVTCIGGVWMAEGQDMEGRPQHVKLSDISRVQVLLPWMEGDY